MEIYDICEENTFVECLMILFYDSVERLINIHIIAVVVTVKSGIIAN